jgi:hypothetical protein
MAKETTISHTQGIGSKMRIKLFDENNLMLSDRLVEQTTELTLGPKEPHKHSLSIELNLYDQTQVDMAITYLKKLKGDLPIEEKTAGKVKKDKTIEKMLTDKEPLLDLIKTLKTKATTQEKLIDMLREYQFVFVSGDVIEDMGTHDPNIKKQIEIRQKDKEAGYQYMVRLVKQAKEPMNDKYDFRLVFGIKIIGEKLDKAQLYLWGKYEKTWTLPWEDKKKVNFKKVEKVYIFPDFMDYVDRKKWRTEHRKWEIATNKGEKPEAFELSKFYLKYHPYIKGY